MHDLRFHYATLVPQVALSSVSFVTKALRPVNGFEICSAEISFPQFGYSAGITPEVVRGRSASACCEPRSLAALGGAQLHSLCNGCVLPAVKLEPRICAA